MRRNRRTDILRGTRCLSTPMMRITGAVFNWKALACVEVYPLYSDLTSPQNWHECCTAMKKVVKDHVCRQKCRKAPKQLEGRVLMADIYPVLKWKRKRPFVILPRIMEAKIVKGLLEMQRDEEHWWTVFGNHCLKVWRSETSSALKWVMINMVCVE